MIRMGLLLFYLTQGGAYDLPKLREKGEASNKQSRRIPPLKRNKKASDLFRYEGTWQVDDLAECLDFVRETRSKTEF